MGAKTVTAKGITEKFNLPYHTVNYYTAIGLFPVINKRGTRRLYDGAIVAERMKKISEMITEGYPLRLIRKRLSEEEV